MSSVRERAYFATPESIIPPAYSHSYHHQRQLKNQKNISTKMFSCYCIAKKAF